jgi:hypothetical protein
MTRLNMILMLNKLSRIVCGRRIIRFQVLNEASKLINRRARLGAFC